MGENKQILVSAKVLQKELGGHSGIQDRLFKCAQTGNLDGLGLMLDAGADINEDRDDRQYGNRLTPLMAAVIYGHPKAAEFLIRQGADLEATDDSGRTALLWALTEYPEDRRKVIVERARCARLLIAAGADVNAHSGRWTPLMHARSNEHPAYGSCVKILQRAGAVESPDSPESAADLLHTLR